MRIDEMRTSSNVEDRRGMGMGGGGGRRPGPKLAVGGGLGGVILIVLYLLMGGNPQALLSGGGPGGGGGGGGSAGGGFSSGTSSGPTLSNTTLENDPQAKLAAKVLGDTEDVWTQLFQASGERYQEPTLILFSGGVESACGFAESAIGPFYCPGDANVYIDLDFFHQLETEFNAAGDFAQAYVIAHEVGHHVQNLLGTSTRIHQMQRQMNQARANELSVRLELQADFFAGVWAHHAQKQRRILEPGDIEEAIRAAAAIGDDRLQKQARGYVVPDSFTHGTSEQRIRWFKLGYETGDPAKGDTFSIDRP
ncbi:MAG: zinc metallopeptidase [Phycisphaerales bacterium]|nr:zinc metallopeptidase [Phycisphaerales bacterium]